MVNNLQFHLMSKMESYDYFLEIYICTCKISLLQEMLLLNMLSLIVILCIVKGIEVNLISPTYTTKQRKGSTYSFKLKFRSNCK